MVGLLISMGIALHLSWPWWLAILGLIGCWIGSAPLMWIVNLVLNRFRRPHPIVQKQARYNGEE